MSNNKKKSLPIKGLIIIIVIFIIIVGLIIYKKVVPIYSMNDRIIALEKKRKEDDTVVGWLKVQGTNIDYPVVYSLTDKFANEEYEYDYLWSNNDSLTLNTRVIVWGHNIRNVSNKPLINEKSFNYFENLPSYLYFDFVKDNKYIQYTINGKNYIYKIYAVSMVDKEDFDNNETMNQQSREKYINKVKEDSYFNFDINVDSKKKLITLATCTRFYGQTSTIIRIDGVMVDDNESLTNYKVSKTKKYTEIEKTMKGDEDNESEKA